MSDNSRPPQNFYIREILVALIVGFVSSMVTTFVTVTQLKTGFEYMSDQFNEHKKEQVVLRKDLNDVKVKVAFLEGKEVSK